MTDKKVVSLVSKKEEARQTPREIFEEMMKEDDIKDVIILGFTDSHSTIASTLNTTAQVCLALDSAKLVLLMDAINSEGDE